MDLIDVDEFLTYYYRDPTPERAAAVLAWCAASEHVADPRSSAPTGYFFARLAQRHPDLVSEYDRVARDAPAAGRDFVAGILRQLAGGPSGLTNAVDRPLVTATENDLLWAEFMLTGSHAPIAALIGQLQRPDIVREKLELWLCSWFESVFGDRAEACAQLHTVAGIGCDPDGRTIETPGDLDCLCMLEGVHLRSPWQFAAIRDALPFRLTRREVELIGAKATAQWSLASNANRHPAVLEACEDARAGSDGPVRALLEEIVRTAHAGRRAFDEAMALLERAKGGDAEAQCRVGTLYREGKGVHRSAELAAAWYHRSATLGFPEARYRLGECYYLGEGVPEDEAEARRWLQAAAEHGIAAAQFRLSVLTDGAEAFHWCSEAAKQGYAEAQYFLGVRYFDVGDFTEAVHWYRKAAEQGDAGAQYALGDMYANGYGVPPDAAVAADWFRKALAQGDDAAEEDLAALLRSGKVAARDQRERDLMHRSFERSVPWWRPH
jgi:tetratricopeptide (TPR) repeat protein